MSSETITNPICFALDLPSKDDADRYIHLLEDHVGAFKVGLELFIASGKLPTPQQTARPIILDLKLHDIPRTVARAVAAAGDLGVKFVTMHIQQRATMEAAARAAEPFGIRLLGVTVLTSMQGEDLEDLSMGPSTSVSARVGFLSGYAAALGVNDFVCSPREVATLRRGAPDRFLLVPGIRPLDTGTLRQASAVLRAAGVVMPDDQQRIGTPKQAMADGASMIVVGSPIRDAFDPAAAAQSILASI
jgi:orotidine-5'-phosphate decarboxylase